MTSIVDSRPSKQQPLSSSDPRLRFVSMRTVAVALFVFALCLPSLHAQTTGTLLGTVSDQSGAVLPNAKVTLLNEATQDTRETVANEAGRFTFAGVRPGTYTVKVELANFKSFQRTGFVINAGDTKDLSNINLTIGTSDEVVTVEARTTQVELVNSGERSSVLSTTDIQNLALVSRNVSELLKVLPGVTSVANGTGNGLQFDFANAGSTGSPIGVGLSTNGAPYRGGSMLLLDGANIIDPGCNCWSTAVANPEMTQEVKVQTSNFGADQPNGPVVFTAISKSGSATYHGAGYLTLRNSALNANTWENNHNDRDKPDSKSYYPGGNIGGPVPFTKNKVMFWTGHEYFWQLLPSSSPLTAWVPTNSMRAGNFDPTAADNAAACSAVGGFTPSATNFCNDLSGTVLPDGTALPGGTTDISNYINPNMLALMNTYFPEANADPSGGYNFYLPISSQHNGYVYRGRVDFNFTDNTKLYLSFQYGKDDSFQPAHIWWTPGNSIPFPGGGINNPTNTKTFSANLLHVFSPTLTNEMIFTWNRSGSPYTPADLSAVSRETVGWQYDSVFQNANNIMVPSLYSAGDRSYGEMSQPNIFSNGGEFGLTKAAPAFQDNLTKAWQNHTFKAGFFYSMIGNYQTDFTFPNGVLKFGSLDVTAQSQTNLVDGEFYGSRNPMANLLLGVANQYQEDSIAGVFDMAYRNYSFYGMDDWKVNRRLTLNLGLRFDHVGRWYERTGTGMAVWLPGLYDEDVTAGRANPGVRYHGIDPGIPISGSEAKKLLLSPRLGLAFDVFGTGKTVVRGGWGAYRWNDQYNDYAGPLTTAQGRQTFNLPGTSTVLVNQLGPDLLNLAGASRSGEIFATDPTDTKVPLTYSYNFTVSQQLPWRSLLEVAYVGNQSENLLMGGQSGGAGIGGADFININKIPLGGLFDDDPVNGAVRPADLEFTGTSGAWEFRHYYPYWEGYGTNPVKVAQHVGYSNYHGLQVAWVRQGSRLNFNLNYTWSKALGIVNKTIDPFTVHGNYGVLNIDRPHVISTSYSYDVGNPFTGSKVLQGVVNGWTISGITTWQAGGNLQATNNSGQDFGLQLTDVGGASLSTKTYYGTDKGVILPIYTCDPSANLSGDEKIKLECLSAPDIGEYGVRQLPYVSGPSYFNQDLTVHKSFAITERQKVEFRVSAFNLFNHPLSAFSGWEPLKLKFIRQVDGSWAPDNLASNWGEVDTKTSNRVLQLGFKYIF